MSTPRFHLHLDKRSQNVIPPLQAKVQPSHPSNHEIHGYMPGRREFEVEHENEAEVPIKDMIFNEDDGPTEVDLKCTMLDIYNSKLDRRVERKQFVFDRGLLDFKKVQLAERKKSKEEKDALQQTRPFARLMSNDDYNNFVAGLVAEDQIRQRIVQLQEYRRNGITSFAEAENFEQQKRARIAAIARSPFGMTCACVADVCESLFLLFACMCASFYFLSNSRRKRSSLCKTSQPHFGRSIHGGQPVCSRLGIAPLIVGHRATAKGLAYCECQSTATRSHRLRGRGDSYCRRAGTLFCTAYSSARLPLHQGDDSA